MQRFGRRLRTWRTAANLSQEELAALVGVEQQTVSGWENGKAPPKRDNVRKLARVLNIAVAKIELAIGEDAAARDAGIPAVGPGDIGDRLDSLEAFDEQVSLRLTQIEERLARLRGRK